MLRLHTIYLLKKENTTEQKMFIFNHSFSI